MRLDVAARREEQSGGLVDDVQYASIAVTFRWLPESTSVQVTPSKRSANPKRWGKLEMPTAYRLSMLVTVAPASV